MYNEAKKAREANKAKAKRLANAKSEKVDSSTFKPAEPLNADVKTGMRPISRRAYRTGGKVEGEAPKANAGRKPRKSGGKADANAWVNRDAKAANEEREGKKHIGGMKAGGRAERANGGSTYGVKSRERLVKSHGDDSKGAKVYKNSDTGEFRVKFFKDGVHKKNADYFADDADDAHGTAKEAIARGLKAGGRAKKNNGGANVPLPPEMPEDVKKIRAAEAVKEMRKDESKQLPGDYPTNASGYADPNRARKRGGRTKKMDGGPMGDPRLGMVKDKMMNFAGNPVTPGLKKGGKAEKHDDASMDKALIKKMVKPSARTGKAGGGDIPPMVAGRPDSAQVKAAAKEYGPREEVIDRAMRQIENKFSPSEMRKMRAERAARMANDKGLQDFIAQRKDRKDKESMKDAGYKSGGRSKRATGGMIAETKKQAALKADPHNQTKIKPQATQDDSQSKNCGGRAKRNAGGRIAKFGGGGLAAMGSRPASAGAFANPMGGRPATAPMATPNANAMANANPNAAFMAAPAAPVAAPAVMPAAGPAAMPAQAMGPMAGGMPPQAAGALANLPPQAVQALANEVIRGRPGMYNTGGRVARKSGGRAKGKTNINIVISQPGAKQDAPMGLPPALPGGPAAILPTPPAGGPQGGPPPVMMPPPGPPVARKSGGRVKMHAGAGSGEGRLEKTARAKRMK